MWEPLAPRSLLWCLVTGRRVPGARSRQVRGVGAMANSAKKRVVILGGGFGGVYTAMELEKLRGRKDDYEITLVNRENYFVYQPMLAEIISGSIGVFDTVSPLRRLLPK